MKEECVSDLVVIEIFGVGRHHQIIFGRSSQLSHET